MNDKLNLIKKELLNCFIKIFCNQNNEELILLDDDDKIFNYVEIATLQKLDRTINNKQFDFKHNPNILYAVFISLAENKNYGIKRSPTKIIEKNIKVNFQSCLFKTPAMKTEKKLLDHSLVFIENETNDFPGNGKEINLSLNKYKDLKDNDSFDFCLTTNSSHRTINYYKGISNDITIVSTRNRDQDVKNEFNKCNTKEHLNAENKYISQYSNKENIQEIGVIDKEKNILEQNNKFIDIDNEDYKINLKNEKVNDQNFYGNKVDDFQSIKNEEKYLHQKILSNPLFNNKRPSKNFNSHSTYNANEYIESNKNKSNENMRNEIILNPDELLNFDYDKKIYYLSFVKLNENKIFSKDFMNKIKMKIIESDNNSFNKKGRFFYQFIERLKVINNLEHLNYFLKSNNDHKSFLENDDIEAILNLLKVKNRLTLNREYTFINHTNKVSFQYFYSKSIKTNQYEKMTKLEKRINHIPIIDIETRKYDKEQKVIEDGVLHVVFIICENIQNLINLFAKIKYEVYYSKYALTNYISKYVYDILYDYTHISDSFLSFIKSFGFVSDGQERSFKKVSPDISNKMNVNHATYPESSNKDTNEDLNLDQEQNNDIGDISFADFKADKNSSEENENLNMNDHSSSSKTNLEINYPNKMIVKNLNEIIRLNQIQYLLKNIVGIKPNNNLNLIPYPKFVKLFHKYNSSIMNDEGLRLKHSYIKNENARFWYFKKFLSFEKQDKISKDHKLNNNKIIKHFFDSIGKEFFETKDFYKYDKKYNLNIENPIEGRQENIFEMINSKNVFNSESISSINEKNIKTQNQHLTNKSYQEIEINTDDKSAFTVDTNHNINNISNTSNRHGKKENLDKFIINSLNRYISKDICRNGFLNIDIIFNDEFNIEDFSNSGCNNKCLNNPKINKCKDSIMGCMFVTLSKCLDFLNQFLKVNEGFYHKHISIMNYSYNFNEKNIIFTFNTNYDTSKKNKIRIFDIFFNQLWITHISYLVLYIYKKCYFFNNKSEIDLLIKGFFFEFETNRVDDEDCSDDLLQNIDNKNNSDFNEKKNLLTDYKNSIIAIFFKKFAKVVNIITVEFLTNYDNNLPEFKTFCKKISKFPIKKYNTIDNLCQHFANYSIEVLLSKLITWDKILFLLLDNKVSKGNKNQKIDEQLYINKGNEENTEFNKLFDEDIILNFNKYFEPFLNNIDEKMLDVVKHKKNIDAFLLDKNIDEKFLLDNVKKMIKSYPNYLLNLIYVFNKSKNKINKNMDIHCNNSNSKINNNKISDIHFKQTKFTENELTINKSEFYNINTNYLKSENLRYNSSNEDADDKKITSDTAGNNKKNNLITSDEQINNINLKSKLANKEKYESIGFMDSRLSSGCSYKKDFDFYFYDNLTHIFSYRKKQILFEKIKDFSFIHKYNNYITHNLTISFDKHERSVFTLIPEYACQRKKFIKAKKNEIIDCLKFINKIKLNNEKLNIIFYEYLKKESNKIENFIFRQNENQLNSHESRIFADINFSNIIEDTSIFSEIKNLTDNKNNSEEQGFFSYRLGHFLFIYRRPGKHSFQRIDQLIEYLINQD